MKIRESELINTYLDLVRKLKMPWNTMVHGDNDSIYVLSTILKGL